jgi:23S rRNA (adenine2030-N6)-methyltransferase
MLSYRHQFHAGNPADVLKHTLLTLILEALKQKEKSIFYCDTHAGAGCYALNHPYSQKTAEYRVGIARLWEHSDIPLLLKPYLQAIKAVNSCDQLHYYPGSPAIAATLLRPQDQLYFSECHSTDFAILQHHFKGDRRVHVSATDGYQQLSARLPPPSRRGVIFIDPSYEVKSDYQAVVTALQKGYRRFPTGVYALWYPVVQRWRIEQLLQALQGSGLAPILHIELALQADCAAPGMTASGMLVLNPPWRLERQMAELLPWLQQLLCQPGEGYGLLKWLTSSASR